MNKILNISYHQLVNILTILILTILIIKSEAKEKVIDSETPLEREIKFIEKGLSYNKDSSKDRIFYVRGSIGLTKLDNNPKNKRLFHSSSIDKEYKNGVVYNMDLGYKINDRFSMDLGYSSCDKLGYYNHIERVKYSQKIKLDTVMINGYGQVPLQDRMKAYIGIGIGYSRIKLSDMYRETDRLKIMYGDEKSNNLSYALMAGVGFKIKDNYIINLGYKYQNHGKINEPRNYNIMSSRTKLSRQYKANDKFKIATHNVMIGLEYQLPPQ